MVFRDYKVKSSSAHVIEEKAKLDDKTDIQLIVDPQISEPLLSEPSQLSELQFIALSCASNIENLILLPLKTLIQMVWCFG